MKKADVSAQFNGVKITFSGGVIKQNVVEMVERCQTGACECMSGESKENIEDIEISEINGNVELSIRGKLSVEEIRDAVSKSPLLQ